jgi:predicted O-methyltransferase YrrM
MKKLIGKVLTNIPYIRHAYLSKHNSRFRPGHYYSPVPDVDELRERQSEIWAPRDLAGIDLNEADQKDCLAFILNNESSFDIPEKKTPSKLYYGESFSYPYVDGVVLHAMMAKFRPKNVIEVGSGSSSVCMIDASAQHQIGTRFTFIEPDPRLCLDKVLNKEDYDRYGVSLVEKRVQDVPPAEFRKLEKNDILFIDSSHVSKAGSDVNYLLTEILPILKTGVIIHFHDIYYPFEYTREYLLDMKLVWNEVYNVHNFLLFNSSFKILFFGDYMRHKVKENASFVSGLPQAGTSPLLRHPMRSKNLWIQRV